MERTITQNGGLYALQHGATKKYRGARQKRVIGNKIIRTDELLPRVCGSSNTGPERSRVTVVKGS
jgi:hypothetical protein